ncbi:MAG: SHOCT domain-containing protein [Betaproteobacteria bacterium]|nr:SHOCT domain-containing protein [Betaproteobacteria bacterium]
MMSNGAGGWMMGGMWPLSILFWILIIVGVVLIARWLMARGGQGKASPAESPIDILKTRYAKGEIDKEAFETMKRDIGVRDGER